MKKLSILIPQYNEDDMCIKCLLNSIEIQQSINFNDIEVLICNDGSSELLSESLLKTYSYEIKYYKEPHKGVSATRNFLLLKSNAEYVMFCDSDDCFFSVSGLYIILREIKFKPDCLFSSFYEQYNDGKEMLFIKHEFDTTFIHGKIFNRLFLLSNNIIFNESLFVNEDSYFVTLSQILSSEIRYIHEPFYLWRYRQNSVTRKKDFTFKYFTNMIDSAECLALELIERKMLKEAIIPIMNMSVSSFYTINRDEWLDEKSKIYRENVIEYYCKFKEKFRFIFEAIDMDLLNYYISDASKRFEDDNLLFNKEEFIRWIT